MGKRAPRSRRSGPTAEGIRKDLSAGKLAPVYMLYGQDEVEKDSILKAVVDTAVDPSARTFNLDILHGDEAAISDVVNRASSFPMMAPRRVVVLKRLDRLADADARELLPLVQNPLDTTVLVFTAEKIDGRKKVFQEMRKVGVSVEFKIPYDNEVPGWIQRRATDLGMRIDPEAVHLLHMAVGAQPSDLRNELDKLAIHAGEAARITREDVAWVVSASRGNTVFELNDAIGEHRTADALRILEHLVSQGESPQGILVMMLRHVGILRKASWLQRSGLQQAELAGKLKVPPFFLKGYLQQSRGFSDQAFRTAFEALSEAESQLKSRPRSQYLTILTAAVTRICRPPDPRAEGSRVRPRATVGRAP